MKAEYEKAYHEVTEEIIFDLRNKKKKFSTIPHKHKRPCPCTGDSMVRSEGELVITVTRTSFNIVEDLPYVIWGTLYLTGNNFATVLQNYLPTGVTVVTVLDVARVTFVYTDSLGNSDTIIVSVPETSQISYNEILAQLNTNYMRSELVYFNCNAAISAPILADAQIRNLQSTGLYFNKIGGGRSKSSHLIIPYTRSKENNSVQNTIAISLPNEAIKPDTAWIHSFAYTLLGGGVTSLRFYWEIIVNERINVNEENIEISRKDS